MDRNSSGEKMAVNFEFPHPLCRMLNSRDLDAMIAIEEAAYEFPWTRGIFADCIRVGYECWGLQIGSELIGYTIISQSAGESHLLNLCIHPDWQNRGMGSLLLDHAIDRAKIHQCSCMFLEVRPSNPAGQSLYLKRGFSVVGERPDYYRSHEGRESAVVMRLDFAEENSGVSISANRDPF
jgi:ribosomal-protein-alanine N-acetyltransferase